MAGKMISPLVQVAPPNSRDWWGLGVTVAGQGDSLSFSHGGRDEGFVASAVMWPKLGRGLFILTNGVSGALMNEISRAFADLYGIGAPPRSSRQVVAMEAGVLAPFAGRYQVISPNQRDTLRLDISTGPNQLRMWDPSLQRTRYLLPAGSDEFFDFDTGTPFRFQRENGQPAAIQLGQGPNSRVARRISP
jgi:hypothetical protein